jgi:cell division protein FtsB
VVYRYEQRRDPTRLMWRRLAAAMLLIVVAISVRGVWGVYKKAQESYALRVEAEAKLNDLKQREAELRADISLLSTDRGVEEQLRERYDLGKDNEGVVVIVEPPAPPAEPRPSNFQKFKGWFIW